MILLLNLKYTDKPDGLEYLANLSVDKRVFFNKKKVMDTIIFEQALADTDLELSVDALCIGLGESDLYVGDLNKFGGSHVSRDLILEYLILRELSYCSQMTASI